MGWCIKTIRGHLAHALGPKKTQPLRLLEYSPAHSPSRVAFELPRALLNGGNVAEDGGKILTLQAHGELFTRKNSPYITNLGGRAHRRRLSRLLRHVTQLPAFRHRGGFRVDSRRHRRQPNRHEPRSRGVYTRIARSTTSHMTTSGPRRDHLDEFRRVTVRPGSQCRECLVLS